MRNIVEARAAQPLIIEYGNGLVQIAATIFEVGGRAPQDGDEAAEQLGNGVAGPRIGHADPDTVDMFQSEGTVAELMVPGRDGQNGQYLAPAQADTDVDHPDEAVGEGRLARGQDLECTGRFDAHQAQSCHPIDDGLRTRWCVDAEDWSQ